MLRYLPKIFYSDMKGEDDLIGSKIYSANCFVQGPGLGPIAAELENSPSSEVAHDLRREIDYAMCRVL